MGSPSDPTPIGNGPQWSDAASQWINVNWKTVGYWASVRAAAPLGTDDGLNFLRINHPAPFTCIKYWEVGNECYGTWEVDHHKASGVGPIDPATYAAWAKTFQDLAGEITTFAQLPPISVGLDCDPATSAQAQWTQNVLNYAHADGLTIGFMSDHNYPETGATDDQTLLNGTITVPGSYGNWIACYNGLQTMYTAAGYAGAVPALGTEWNSSSAKQKTSLVNGLFFAEEIGCMLVSNYGGGNFWSLRDGGSGATNNSQYGWRNWGDLGCFGRSINSPPVAGTYIGYSCYYGLQVASKLVGSALNVVSTSTSYSDLPVYAATQTNGHLALMVVNTNPAADITDQITISGFVPSTAANACNAWQFGKAEDLAQSQTSDGSASLTHTTFTIGGSPFNYTFPAYSMTVIDLAPDSSDATPPSAGQRAGWNGRRHLDHHLYHAVVGQLGRQHGQRKWNQRLSVCHRHHARRHPNRQLDLAGQCDHGNQDRLDVERGADLLLQRASGQWRRTHRKCHELQRPNHRNRLHAAQRRPTSAMERAPTSRPPSLPRSCRLIGTPARTTKVESAAISMPSAPRPAAPKPSIGFG